MKKKLRSIFLIAFAFVTLFVVTSCSGFSDEYIPSSGDATYTITFKWENADGRACEKNVLIKESQAIRLTQIPNIPSVLGYVRYFGVEGDITESEVDIFAIRTDTVLVVYQKVQAATAIFNSNGGTSVASIENCAVGESLQAYQPADPTRQGYDFIGWYTDKSLATPFDWLAKLPAEGIVLYAKWNARTDTPYKVEYYYQGLDGNYTLDHQENFTGITDRSLVFVPDPVEGYLAQNVNYKIQGDGSTVVRVEYTRRTYEAKFIVEGTEYSKQNVMYGGTINVPTNPTKEGYVFTGWNLAIPTTMPAANQVFVAEFSESTAVNYTVRHNFEKLDGSYELRESKVYNDGVTGTEITAILLDVYTGFTPVEASRKGIVLADGSLVINVNYTRNSYKMTFNVAGGTPVNEINDLFESTIPVVLAPTRAGYTFDGWDIAIPTTMPASNVTYTAKWIANTDTAYIVKYYQQNLTNQYEVVETSNLQGTTDTVVNAVIKTYSGFTHDATNPNNVLSGNVAGDESLVLNVYYTRNSYTLTFDTKGGSEVSAITDLFGSTIPTIQDPTRTGYTFDGWDVAIPTTMPASNVTYTAKWIANTDTAYIVKYYQQNLTNQYEVVETSNLQGTTDTVVNAVIKTYSGFTHDATNPNNVLSGNVAGDGSLVLNVYYTRNSYTLTFDTKGGSEVSAITDLFGSTIPTIQDPTRAGYTFDGWDIAIPTTMPAEDTTYTAKWIVNTDTAYIVKYYQQNLTNQYEVVETSNLQGTTDTVVNAVIKTYSGFTHDATNPNNVLSGNVAGDGSLVLNVYYTRNSYTLTFDTKGGSEVSAITDLFGSTIPTIQDPTRTGYTFDGWDIAIPTTMPASNITYTAKWIAINYNITFNLNGGAFEKPYTNFDEVRAEMLKDYNAYSGKNYTAETIPTGSWENINIHTFFYSNGMKAKWSWVAIYLSQVGGDANKDACAALVNNNDAISFTAINSNYSYAVSYEFRAFMMGGKFKSNANYISSDYSLASIRAEITKHIVFVPKTYNIESSNITLVEPIFADHVFVGWYEKADFTGEQATNIPTGSYGNKNFYAKWISLVEHTQNLAYAELEAYALTDEIINGSHYDATAIAGIISAQKVLIKACTTVEDVTTALADAKIAVNISANPIPPTGITLNAAMTTPIVGAKLTVTPSVTGPTGYVDLVTWTSTDETIATVDNGLVTFIANGLVTIKATSVIDNSIIGTIDFTVQGTADMTTLLVDASVVEGEYRSIESVDYYEGVNLFKTINDAIAAANANQTITVLAGTYNENVVMNKAGLVINGPNKDINPNIITRKAEAIIKSIQIAASDCVINGVALANATTSTAVISGKSGMNISNITIKYVVVQSQTTFNANNTGIFNFTNTGNYEYSNIKILYSKVELSTKRPTLLYINKVNGLDIIGNAFHGSSDKSFYTDCVKLDSTQSFGLKGIVNIEDNIFENYHQYLLWFRSYGAGTYTINNNTFKNCGQTKGSHATLALTGFVGSNTDIVEIYYTYNKVENSIAAIRIDASTNITATNFTVKANYNIIKNDAPTYHINNKDTDFTVDGTNNYYNNAPTDANCVNTTWNPYYATEAEVPIFRVSHNISYQLYEGTNDKNAPTTYEEGVGLTVLPTPTRNGYTFLGWYDAPTGGNKIESISASETSDVTLHAQWELIQYTIYFYSDDTDVAFEDATYTANQTIVFPTPTNTGYAIEGWYERVNNVITDTKFDSTTMPTRDVYIEVKWVIVEYTVTFNMNGGSWGYGSKEDMINDFIADVNSFYGWSGANALVRSDFTAADATEVRAKCTAFCAKVYGASPSYLITTSTTTNRFFTCDAYKDKWLWLLEYVDVQSSSTLTLTNSNTAISSNSSFHVDLWGFLASAASPVWSGMGSTTTDWTGAKGTDFLAQLATAANLGEKYTIESSDLLLGTPTKVGNNFDGWYENADFSGSPITSITTGSVGNKTVYAKWLATATFNYTFANKTELLAAFTHDFYDFLIAKETITSAVSYETFSGINNNFIGTWFSYTDVVGDPTANTVFTGAGISKVANHFIVVNSTAIKEDYFMNSTKYGAKWKTFGDWINTSIGTSNRFWTSAYGRYELFRWATGEVGTSYGSNFNANIFMASMSQVIKYGTHTTDVTLPTFFKVGATLQGWEAADGTVYTTLPISNPVMLVLTPKF